MCFQIFSLYIPHLCDVYLKAHFIYSSSFLILSLTVSNGFLQETSYNHLLHPTPSSICHGLQNNSSKNNNYNAHENKETDVESTAGFESSSLALPNHQQFQRNSFNW